MNKTCKDITTEDEAIICYMFGNGDLDRDGDGHICEEYF